MVQEEGNGIRLGKMNFPGFFLSIWALEQMIVDIVELRDSGASNTPIIKV